MKLCSMACLGIGNPSGFVLHQEQGLGRVIKDCSNLTTLSRLNSLNLRPHQYEEPLSGLFEPNNFVKIDTTVRRLVLNNVQVKDPSPSSLLFSYGIAEKCAKLKKILQYLQKEGSDLTLLSESMEFQMISSDAHQLHLPLVDFMEDTAFGSKLMVQPDGRVLFTGTGSEMKDLLSLITEFYSAKDLTLFRKQSLLVPHFNRLDGGEAQTLVDLSSLKLEALTVAPLKSPEKVNLNPTHQKRKKNIKKQSGERDLYKKNSFHACESLLSLIVDRNRHNKTELLSLKKSGPELPELLTRFSAGVAGTGLAVLFSVVCGIAMGTVPFCGTKLLSTGFGFGLVWLASAVNGLRDVIVHVSKDSKKVAVEEEMARKVDSSVKEIYFRAVTVMAFAVLRFA